ncbi:MAG: pantetheine-phosphate adenylyltransferase [Dehalococcoidia bacterium]|jgi:pantetheine-phosphate adenylyltransferase|nr:MAG: pantetheine-phosphate adenylyltransferase [Chloroflexota bacterium]|tara:strand:- start:642 stop:1118 length:477 start_codon:yes stop_codon:yes gene_type:complete
MTVAMYPGRFDPVTNGHLDIVGRASKIFDEVIVAVSAGSDSTNLFTPQERVEMFSNEVKSIKNIKVQIFDGLTIDVAKNLEVDVLIRGLRAVTDFTTEFDMALMNRDMAQQIESIFFITSLENLFLSASRVRELASFGGDVKKYVPLSVSKMLDKKFK